MDRFEAHYDQKAIARISAVLRVFVVGGFVMMSGVFVYYALVLSQLSALVHVASFTAMVAGGAFALRVAEARVRRYRTHARSGIPAIIFDSRGVWVHERCGDAPILWEAISDVEELGSGKNSALRIHAHPGVRNARKPIVIADGLYDTAFSDIAAALYELRERYS